MASDRAIGCSVYKLKKAAYGSGDVGLRCCGEYVPGARNREGGGRLAQAIERLCWLKVKQRWLDGSMEACGGSIQTRSVCMFVRR